MKVGTTNSKRPQRETPLSKGALPSPNLSEHSGDLQILKDNLPLVRRLIPPESQSPFPKPYIFKADINVPLVSTGSDVLQKLGFTGKNLAAAVLDSGVAPVPDIKENLIGSYRVSDGKVIRTAPEDPLGHGTAVACLMAGTGKTSGGVYRGMAPDAKIISMQVANEYGGGSYSDLPNAIHWLIKNKDAFTDRQGKKVPLRVINVSMGFPTFLPVKEDPIARAVKAAWNSGILVFSAAGNDGRPASDSPFGTIFAAPANEPSIIAVGAANDKGDPDRSKVTLAGFTSWGPTPEGGKQPAFIANGTNVLSVNVPGSVFDTTARAAGTLREMDDKELYEILKQDDELRKNLGISLEDLLFMKPRELHEQVNQNLPAMRLMNDYLIALSGSSFASPIAAGGGLQILEWFADQGKIGYPDIVKSLFQHTSDKLSRAPFEAQGSGYMNLKKAYDYLEANGTQGL